MSIIAITSLLQEISMQRLTPLFFFALIGFPALHGIAEPSAAEESLAGFKTVETAITAQTTQARSEAVVGQAPYLGVLVEPDKRQRPVVTEVQPDSPAGKA